MKWSDSRRSPARGRTHPDWERARRVAEAQIDLLRVRRARSLLNDARGREAAERFGTFLRRG